ncbi:OLC1v1011153C2 [Oldenlandia corymbosa var. corymbosa]|uniref:OLC1v1011153C2 n=1 Tax=Oldenlandia corymbosa var. corymbosa TaxID=529605 RepID=A0AAV1DT00_OLDCO|nr:OLC1v1011153C2 [Oldenlandia corymbosa var. corymbosa]
MVTVLSSTEQIPSWGSSRCDCFVKGDMWASCDVLSRPALELSIFLHSPNKRTRTYFFRDSCSHIQSPRTQLILSHTIKNWLSLSIPSRDKCKRLKYPRSDSSLSTQILQNPKFSCNAIVAASKKLTNLDETFSAVYEFSEEPWLFQSSPPLSCSFVDSDSSHVRHTESGARETLGSEAMESDILSDFVNGDFCSTTGDKVISENHSSDRFPVEDHPVEEPWLLESLFQPSSISSKTADAAHSEDSLECDDTSVHSQDSPEYIPEKLLTDDGIGVMSKDDSVSTRILINSSICTMQRIAVLENGKLVELLLEPVKNNVQCDSVYLGVVTKLVPHMGGAFVNIGGPKPSFMEIKPRRQPFIFPPFHRHMKGKDVNGSVLGSFGDLASPSDSKTILGEIEEIDFVEEDESEDESEDFMDDEEFVEQENGGNSDLLKLLKRNSNGSVAADDDVEVNCEGHLEKLTENEFQPIAPTVNQKLQSSIVADPDDTKWSQVKKGTKIIVQVVKEGLGAKSPTLTAYPKLKSRFWILSACCGTIGISKKISGLERTRLRVIAKSLQPPGFGLTVRTVAAGHTVEELQKDLDKLLSTWKSITEHAKSAALAADEGVNGAVPVLLHQAMGQTLSVVQDYFNDKVESMIVDSPRTYYEVTNYLQEIAPNLCDRVELYSKSAPLFDEYKIEEELNNLLSKRVPLDNGGYLVIEQTEALVSIDVNGGHCMLGQGTSQEKAILEVNLAAAKQIARELRLRDVGGIIVVDFIDMHDDSNKRLVYEEVKKAVERDRSMVKVSELSKHGLMEITRKRVRPSVTFMISEPCTCCSGTGRVEALETSFSKIEHEICRLLVRNFSYLCIYLNPGQRKR